MEHIRGVVIGPRVNSVRGAHIYDTTNRITAQSITIGGSTIDFSIQPRDLRRYALYWDRLATPIVNFDSGGGIGPMLSSLPELMLLQRESILRVYEVELSSLSGTRIGNDGTKYRVDNIYPMSSIFSDAQIALAKSLVQAGAESWTLAQTGPDLVGESTSDIQDDALELTLHGALPVPSETVPLEDILDFRVKRSPELYQLRHALDSLHSEIKAKGFSARSKVVALEKIDIALADLNKVVNESFLQREISDAKLYLNLPQGTMVATIGALAGSLLGVSLPLAALVGIGMNAAVTFIEKRIKRTIDLPKSASEFIYLYHAAKELGVDVAIHRE